MKKYYYFYAKAYKTDIKEYKEIDDPKYEKRDYASSYKDPDTGIEYDILFTHLLLDDSMDIREQAMRKLRNKFYDLNNK